MPWIIRETGDNMKSLWSNIPSSFDRFKKKISSPNFEISFLLNIIQIKQLENNEIIELHYF